MGQGAYGKVKSKYRKKCSLLLTVLFVLLVAKNEDIGEHVAFKILNKKKIKELGMRDKVKREIRVMRKLKHHPHIIYLFDVIDTASDIFLALELASGGDFYTHLANHGKVSLFKTAHRHTKPLTLFFANRCLRRRAGDFSSS